jgi:hypothetical protein
MNGTTRGAGPVFDTKFFTPEVRFDMNYLQDFNHPVDHTITGSTEELRAGEFQIDQVGLGGNFHWQGVEARFLLMFGLYAPASLLCNNGSSVGADNCAAEGGGWYPDLRTREVVWGAGVLVKF